VRLHHTKTWKSREMQRWKSNNNKKTNTTTTTNKSASKSPLEHTHFEKLSDGNAGLEGEDGTKSSNRVTKKRVLKERLASQAIQRKRTGVKALKDRAKECADKLEMSLLRLNCLGDPIHSLANSEEAYTNSEEARKIRKQRTWS
jgi:hypothetical protein